ncbi:MAG TPA: glycosyltransferase family 39 protein, partial [Methylomirabilota bacterium]|nr:glycosyltransferase family 39 protein [Methylomirabilota bacterium]
VLASAAAVGARLATAVATDLYYDEAYYWVWSQRFAGAYYDNTPLVAWVLAGGRVLLGEGALAVRGLAILSGLAAAAAAWALARELWGDARAGVWAALLTVTSPGAAVAGTLLSPDSVLEVFWLLALIALWRAFAAPEAVGRWVLAGVMAGLALLSKYTAGLLLPGALAFALVDPAARRALARPGPYIGALTALVVFAPVLVWNISHDWAGLAFQIGRYRADRGVLIVRLLDYVGGQWLFAGPVLFPIGLAAALAFSRADARHRFLACTALPVLAFFLLSAFRTYSHPNWPAFVWPALAAGVAGVAAGRVAAWRRVAVLSGAAVCVILAALMVWAPFPGGPVKHVHGWSELAAAVRPLDDGGMIYSDSYPIGSSIAFALRASDRVWVVRRPTHRLTAWDFWERPPIGGSALFLSRNPSPPPDFSSGRYSTMERLPDIVIRLHGTTIRTVRVWRLRA